MTCAMFTEAEQVTDFIPSLPAMIAHSAVHLFAQTLYSQCYFLY